MPSLARGIWGSTFKLLLKNANSGLFVAKLSRDAVMLVARDSRAEYPAMTWILSSFSNSCEYVSVFSHCQDDHLFSARINELTSHFGRRSVGVPGNKAKSYVGRRFAETQRKVHVHDERNFSSGNTSTSPKTFPTKRLVVQLSWVWSIWLMG